MLKKSVRDSARFAVRKVLSLWNMAHIPKTIERNAVEKLEQLFDKWIKMKKSSRRAVPRHFVYRHFVYTHFVYYCIPPYITLIHPTSVSANHYFHQSQLLFTCTL